MLFLLKSKLAKCSLNDERTCHSTEKVSLLWKINRSWFSRELGINNENLNTVMILIIVKPKKN